MANWNNLSGTTKPVFSIGPLTKPLSLDTTNYTVPHLLKFPDNDGSSGYVLDTDGAGNLNWVPAGGSMQTPYYIPLTETFTVDTDSQVLFSESITIDGTLIIDGDLIDVFSDPYVLPSIITPGSFTDANITVDAQGRIIAASNGGIQWALYTGSSAKPVDSSHNNLTLNFGSGPNVLSGSTNQGGFYAGSNIALSGCDRNIVFWGGDNYSGGGHFSLTGSGVTDSVYISPSDTSNRSLGNRNVIIGAGSYSTTDDNIAIGNAAYADYSCISIGLQSSAGSTGNASSLAIGHECNVIGTASFGLGPSNYVSGNYSSGIGFSATVTGNHSIGISGSSVGFYVSGNNSIAMGSNGAYYEPTMSGNNSIGLWTGNTISPYHISSTCSGNNTVSIGGLSTITGSNSVAICGMGQLTVSSDYSIAIVGNNGTITGGGSIAIGNAITVNGPNSIALGTGTYVNGAYSFATGNTTANFNNSIAIGATSSGGYIDFAGQTQLTVGSDGGNHPQSNNFVTLWAQTPDVTPIELGTGQNSTYTPTSYIALTNNSTYAFNLTLVARVSPVGTDYAMWTVQFGCSMEGGPATTTIFGTPLITQIAATAGAIVGLWGVAVTADVINGRPAIFVTGQASTIINWVMTGSMTMTRN